ncbi:uncharacterized protein LOC106641532 [Copidosoma floridanum]|uniref:uncharacterized protein LOC106641532 n=1 Tax=Copidosoma floridanum TaxID=29053 RepID=UPI000C6F6F57|nr:uncharacterized protein LOC106641532 [Copidosoma floridanum]
MKLSRAYLAVGVLLGIVCVLEANVAHRRHKHQANNEVHDVQGETDREHKLLIECQHEDYRTYIKCLKREKRQHTDGLGGLKRNCLNECFETNCTTSACIQDCYKRCRTRLTYREVVETIYDCNGEECKTGGSGAVVPNITTNIHIHNILPNVTNCTDKASTTSQGPTSRGGGGGERGGGTGGTTTGEGHGPIAGLPGGQNYSIPRIDIHNEINNHYGSRDQDCPCPNTGCNCNSNNNYPYNPWQAMPQITIGFGAGPVGGCMYPWPCFPKYPQPQQPSIDCSMCFLYQYRCDPSCFPGHNNTQSTTTQKPTPYSYPARRQRKETE